MEYRPFGLLDMAPGFPAGGVSGRTPVGADNLGRLLYSMTGAGGAQDAAGLLGGPSVRENLKAGNNFDAGLQMLAALPVFGMLGTAGKAAKGAVKAAEEAAPAAEKYIIAYHGSPNSFDQFDMNYAGTTTDPGQLGRAHYFSTDASVPKSYPHKYEARINLKNPLKISLPNFRTDKSDVVRDALGLERSSPSKSVTDAATEKGFDGVILDYSPTGYEHQEIAVFDDSLIDILKKYGLVGLLGGGAAMGAAGDKQPQQPGL